MGGTPRLRGSETGFVRLAAWSGAHSPAMHRVNDLT